jgi:hypothetical protein
MRRAALREALLRRTGTVPNTSARYGPGSAAHRSASATRCAASGERKPITCRSRTCECIPIPVLTTSLILLVSCPMRGRFPEAILQRTERKLAGPGRPGTVDGLVAGGALGGAAPSLGRARLPCRARWVHPPPQGCPLVPWRLPPLHPLARFARDWQTSDALRRENVEAWLFESTGQKLRKAPTHTPRRPANAGTHTLRRRDAGATDNLRQQLAQTKAIGGHESRHSPGRH